MVRVGDMLKKKKSMIEGDRNSEAVEMFRSHATNLPGDTGDAPTQVVDFKVFQELIRTLIDWSNKETLIAKMRLAEEKRDELRLAFDRIDDDKSGIIDQEEIKSLCAALKLPPKQMARIMKRLDGDGDGKVTFDEFAEAMNPGGDSSNLANEPPEYTMPSAKDLKGAFKMADADKSGFVDEAEFLLLFEQVLAGKVRGMGGGIEYYRKPTAHMRWGDPEFHPDTDWQDLFFDLLFAGGAFCGAGFLGESLINGQEVEGFFYFLLMFLCLANQWVMRIHYCSRYASTSMFHALVLEQLEFLLIATATWHIPLSETNSIARYASSRLLASTYYSSSDTMVKFTPVEQMRANVKGCAAGFSLCLALNGLLYVCRWAEIKYDPAASKGSKAIANYAVKMYSATTACFFGAFALASATSDEYYEDETSAHCRWLWFGAIVVLYGSLAFWTSTYGALDEYEAKTHSVPMSVTYVIVRVGEWTMVMLGETVLSLLGVSLENDMIVYLMFVCSMLMAANLQFQGFTLHPIHAEHHVLSKGQFSLYGLLYLIWGTVFYATILVIIGTSAKVLCKKASYGKIFVAANWCLCGALAAAFISILSFQWIHHHAIIEDHEPSGHSSGGFRLTRMHVLKIASVVLLVIIAALEFEPSTTVFGCYAVVLTQSILVMHGSSDGIDDEDHHEVDLLGSAGKLALKSHKVAPINEPAPKTEESSTKADAEVSSVVPV